MGRRGFGQRASSSFNIDKCLEKEDRAKQARPLCSLVNEDKANQAQGSQRRYHVLIRGCRLASG